MSEREWLACDDPLRLRALLMSRAPAHALPMTARRCRLFASACLAFASETLAQHPDVFGRYEYGENGETIAERIAWDVAYDWLGRQREYDPPGSTKAHLLREIRGNPWSTLRLGERHRTPTVYDLAEAAYLHRFPKGDCRSCAGCGMVLRAHVDPLPVMPLEATIPTEMPVTFSEEVCPCCQGRGSGWGTLDPLRLLVLADALEEAGCEERVLLGHLRGREVCWNCLGSGRAVVELYAVNGELAETSEDCDLCAGSGFVPLRGSHVRGCWALDLVLGRID